MHRRLATALSASTLALVTVVATAATADAAPADKPEVLASWTQTSASSYTTWAAARADRAPWSAYAFDWSTDYCSSSPDNPFGFPFSMSCARHDFGYRNYKAAGAFSANKSRLDSAFYEDLKRVCAKYGGGTKSACDSTAWTYYQAVKAFG
ncbi:phospholipase [Streptomyces sp. NPDC091972]|uniref:phospholipase n=1 Tax=Streptomyces sp. NPDC091972 TaxID=3366007 RepID=UPI0037FE50FC